jgi:nucleoside-diphosphate-sugar epimerase
VSFSTGNVYPLMPIAQGGATEQTPVGPVGEYAQSALGRERMFEYGSAKWGTRGVILRLNYAVELRYGVLVDIGLAVFQRRPVTLAMPHVNVIWQGEANSWCLRSFAHCQSPPLVLNITGTETLSVRELAHEFGRHFDRQPIFASGDEGTSALLNDASKARELFGNPKVRTEQMIGWIADWIRNGGTLLNKPTHFQARDGKF